MEPERSPFSKVIDTPFITLDETSIEMGSILFLFLIVVLIAHVKKRRQMIRHVVQMASLIVFFFFVYSCLGVFGMIRNGLYGATLIGTAYSESFYWLALPVVIIAVTLYSGSVFCGWICPTGTVQELAAIVQKRLPRAFLKRTPIRLAVLALVLLAFTALTIWIALDKRMFIEDSSLHWAAALLLLCYLVLLGVIDDLPTRKLRIVSVTAIVVTAISHITITSPVHFAFTARDDPASALSTLIIMLASLVVARSWCRYLCPWGAVMGFLQKRSRLQIQRDDHACTHCGKCDTKCDVGALEGGRVRNEHCQFCYACVDVCPTGALRAVDVWARDKGRDKGHGDDPARADSGEPSPPSRSSGG